MEANKSSMEINDGLQEYLKKAMKCEVLAEAILSLREAVKE